MISGKIIGN